MTDRQTYRILGVVGFIGLVVLGYKIATVDFSPKPEAHFPKSAIHWHMPVSLEICGKETPIVAKKQEHGLIHGHNDGQMHIEGRVRNDEDASLGKYFDSIGVAFSNTQIDTWTNGKKCENSQTSGKVSMTVNGNKNTEFRNFIPKEGDKIVISFQ